MYVSRKALKRRTFLRGMGTVVALPLLDAMIPALSAKALKPTPRLGFIYIANGVIQEQWVPSTTGGNFALPRILQPLEPVRSHINILTGLSRLDRQTEYVVLCRPDDVESGDVLGRNFRMVPEAAPLYSVGEQFKIPMALARERVQMLHEPHYVLPPLVRCRSVVTIHDCIHLMFPQYLPGRLAYIYAKGSMWSAARKAMR